MEKPLSTQPYIGRFAPSPTGDLHFGFLVVLRRNAILMMPMPKSLQVCLVPHLALLAQDNATQLINSEWVFDD